MTDIILSDVTVLSIDNPVADVEVVTVGIPGLIGPQGPQGPAGQPNILTIGTVTTGAPGSSASASVSGASPNQVLSLVLPQGQQGPQGDTGAPANLTMGTVTTLAAGSSASATLTGTAPNYTLSLSIPQGASGGGVVTGGVTGDVLMKNSATNFDTKWSTPTSAATPSTLMERDANGRASVADPSASTDIATKNYTDTKASIAGDLGGTAASPQVTSGAHHTHASSQISDAASAATPSTVVIRDAAGRASVVDPSASTDIATKNYADTKASIAGDLGGTAASPQVTSGTHHTHTSSQISDAASAATASKVIIRDGSGRASVADPSASTDISTKNYTDTQDAAMRRPTLNTQTASYTLALTDERKLVQMNSASATTLTVPLNSSVAFAIGTVIEVQMLGTGNVTIAPAGGVTLNSTLPSLVMTRQYAVVLLQKTGTDTWNVDRISNASATSASTASTLILRDTNGRASVADPSASTDISTKNYTDTQDLSMRRPVVNTQTASYTLVLTDERKLVQLNSASATTLTVPPNSSVAFAVGTVIDVQMLGAGNVTIAPGAAVTINAPDSLSVMTRQYSVVRLLKIATDTWELLHIGSASATSTSTANTFVKRDASGRASVADPSASTDIATKNYVDGKLAGKITVGTTAPSSPATNDLWVDTN